MEVLKSWKRVPWEMVESWREPLFVIGAPEEDTLVSFVALTTINTAPTVAPHNTRMIAAENPVTARRFFLREALLVFSDSKSNTSVYASSPVVNLDLDRTRAKNIRGYQSTGGARVGWDRGVRARGGGGLHRRRHGGGQSFRAATTTTTTTTMMATVGSS